MLQNVLSVKWVMLEIYVLQEVWNMVFINDLKTFDRCKETNNILVNGSYG